MRLWHEILISDLPRAQLLGQHRECCALRGGGWGKPHKTVNYVFAHPYEYLFQYHSLVMEEMKRRGYRVSDEWLLAEYRGRRVTSAPIDAERYTPSRPIYPEHDGDYLAECLQNLATKGVHLPKH